MAGSGLEAFHLTVTLHLPHLLKWTFLAIINNHRPKADVPFPWVWTARCPVCVRIYNPTSLVVRRVPRVTLANHPSHEGVCKTSAGSAARWWLQAAVFLALFCAFWCTKQDLHEEGSGCISQPPLGHSALTKEVQENRDEVILCYRNCTIVLYCSSAIVGPCHGIFQQLSSMHLLKS